MAAVPILPMHGAGIIPAFLANFGQAGEQVSTELVEWFLNIIAIAHSGNTGGPWTPMSTVLWLLCDV